MCLTETLNCDEKKTMKNLNYKKYLNSSIWKNTKIKFNKSKYNKNKCYICGEKNVNLHLHHKTYERLGKERLTDLVQLCGPCHTLVHFVLNDCKDNTFTLWNVARKCRTLFKKTGQSSLDGLINKKIKRHHKKKNKIHFIENIENGITVIKMTSEIMKFAKSRKGGWSMKQLRLLGINELKKNWKKHLLKKKFPQDVIKQFIALKNQHLDWDQEEFNNWANTKENKLNKKHDQDMQSCKKAYQELCDFEKNSKKIVKIRKTNKLIN